MVFVLLLAGSEPATVLAFHFDMDIDDSKQHPWFEYSVWQEQEWVRIYTPGQPQRWHRGDAVPDLPENSFREWQRVIDPNEPVQAWDIRDWQHQGYQRILSRIESFATHYPHDQPLGQVQDSDAVPIEETFTYDFFFTVIARLLRKSLQSSMASLATLNVVISRSRLLSGLGLCLAPLAVVDILVNDRDSRWSM